MMLELRLTKRAKVSLERLDASTVNRIRQALLALREDQRPFPQSRKLRGYASVRRLRIGDWRAIYEVIREDNVILIHEIIPRGDNYRNW